MFFEGFNLRLNDYKGESEMQSKMKNKSIQTTSLPRTSLAEVLKKDWRANKLKYLMALPVLVWLFLFCYKPLYGIVIAFKDYSPRLGFLGSPWAGFKHFESFLSCCKKGTAEAVPFVKIIADPVPAGAFWRGFSSAKYRR